MKRTQPAAQPAVIGIDVLYMYRATHADAGPQVDRRMFNAELPGKHRIGRMAIAHQ
ncbi:hypothetical protein D3C81_2163030 [compost metagenome]